MRSSENQLPPGYRVSVLNAKYCITLPDGHIQKYETRSDAHKGAWFHFKENIEVLGRINIKKCARCGLDHTVLFKKLRRPSPPYQYWGECPETLEPILMEMVEI